MIVVFGPCRALREEGTLSKMFVQFNILDIICAKHLGEFLGSWIVDLSGAQLSGAQLSVFLRWTIGPRTVGPGAQLSGAQLSVF